MEQTNDPSGFIAECVSRLLAVGFDASAFETAKWAGIACLVGMAISIIAGFGARLIKAKDIEGPITESQFRWLLSVGALLIALPIVAKITTDQLDLTLQSGDRAFAQDVCREQAQTVAQSAELGALEARLQSLEAELASVQPFSSDSAQIIQRSPLFGQAISIFYRAERSEDASTLRGLLTQDGAGVAIRETDLRETTLSRNAIAGQNFILYDSRGLNAAAALRQAAEAAGFSITETREVGTLRGNALQILMF